MKKIAVIVILSCVLIISLYFMISPKPKKTPEQILREICNRYLRVKCPDNLTLRKIQNATGLYDGWEPHPNRSYTVYFEEFDVGRFDTVWGRVVFKGDRYEGTGIRIFMTAVNFTNFTTITEIPNKYLKNTPEDWEQVSCNPFPEWQSISIKDKEVGVLFVLSNHTRGDVPKSWRYMWGKIRLFIFPSYSSYFNTTRYFFSKRAQRSKKLCKECEGVEIAINVSDDRVVKLKAKIKNTGEVSIELEDLYYNGMLWSDLELKPEETLKLKPDETVTVNITCPSYAEGKCDCPFSGEVLKVGIDCYDYLFKLTNENMNC